MYRNWTNSLVFFLAAPSAMLLGIETAALRSCAVRPNCSRAGKFSSSLYQSTTKSIPACQTLSFRCGFPSLFTTHSSRLIPGLPRCEPNSRASLSSHGSTESTGTPTGGAQNQPWRASAKKLADTSQCFVLGPPLEVPTATSRYSFLRYHEKSQNRLLPNRSMPT